MAPVFSTSQTYSVFVIEEETCIRLVSVHYSYVPPFLFFWQRFYRLINSLFSEKISNSENGSRGSVSQSYIKGPKLIISSAALGVDLPAPFMVLRVTSLILSSDRLAVASMVLSDHSSAP